MGKPEDFDPRVDASVRVQVGKLRQRLESYYATEAPGSFYLMTLPKGHFALGFETVPPPATVPPAPPFEAPVSVPAAGWKWTAIGWGAIVLLLSGTLIALWRDGSGGGAARGRRAWGISRVLAAVFRLQ